MIRINRILFILLSVVILFFPKKAFTQTGINTTSPDINAALDVVSSTKGVLIPRLSAIEVTALEANNPAEGMLLFNKDLNCIQLFTSGVFQCLLSNSKADTSIDSWLDDPDNTMVKLASKSAGEPRELNSEVVIKDDGKVGVGTTAPLVSLDVREPNPDSPSPGAGIAIPQVNNLPASGTRAGQVIYLTTDNKYYFYDGTSWRCLNCEAYFGDIKQSLRAIDHNGWIKLDGRNISTLTASQQSKAMELGYSASLPNATYAYLVQNTSPLGSISGTNMKIINRSNLPNFTLSASGNTSVNGNHTHSYKDKGNTSFDASILTSLSPVADDTEGTYNTGSSGQHSHTVTTITEALNGGVFQEGLDITPRSLSVNTFVYLGY